MDIIKLRNDYLKKINKTASELNRRLSFLNEINNTISHNNMIGGAVDNLNRPSQSVARDNLVRPTQQAAVDVDEIIARNNISTEQIIDLIKKMKATHSDTSKEVIRLRESINISKEAINLLETENGKYIKNINQLSGFINNIGTELRK
jgi:hypothetical protein